MDQFYFISALLPSDYDSPTQPEITANSTEQVMQAPKADVSNKEIDLVALRRERNRLAQRRRREKVRRQLEEENMIRSLDINGTSQQMIDSQNRNAQNLAEFDTTLLQKYHNSKSSSYLDFLNENVILMPSYKFNHAFYEISKSITRVVPSFKLDLDDQELISPINYAALSMMAADGYLGMAGPSYTADLVYPTSGSSTVVSAWEKAFDRLPQNLRPTKLQLSIPHHTSIDIIPWPSVRDKMLLMDNNVFYDYQKCFHELLVWGNRPELDDNWEVTPRFAQQLWFLLDKDIIKRTNWWRSQRDLPPIDLDTIATAQSSAKGKQSESPL